MLNITDNSIQDKIDVSQLKSLNKLHKHSRGNILIYITLGLLFVSILIMFLPWTQSIKGTGNVTTRSPENRPQSVQAVIGGKLDKWFVQEGDLVQVGDTLAYITEVKSD